MATTITVGGKGFSLTSSSVYSLSTNTARLSIDSSALSRLSNTNNNSNNNNDVVSSFPSFLSSPELRASLTILLTRLLNTPSSPVSLIDHISDLLNSNTLNDVVVPVSDSNILTLSTLYGVAAIIDHKASALCSVVDAVAALSCEAAKVAIKGAFEVTDSGDGNVDKDQVGVASDLTVFLNNSKLIAKEKNAEAKVSEIVEIHGSLRAAVKYAHSKVRVWLNSGGKISESGRTVVTVLSMLGNALCCLGESSLQRARSNLDSVGDSDMRKVLREFQERCPKEGFKFGLISGLQEDYVRFVHEVYELLGRVWEVMIWEAVTAFIAVECGELGEKSRDGEGNDKKKKKKKKVLGNGTEVVVQFIKDKLQGSVAANTNDVPALVQSWVSGIYSLLDAGNVEFHSFLEKLQEIVDSNATRRLPKLPKGTRDFGKDQMAIRKKAFSIIEEVFERHGATALDTPVFELRETLTGKYGEDSKLIYDLADQGGELCSLRYDLTVPFARYVAMHGITSLKRYQIAKVYRRDNPSKGRYREFYQCDFDVAGQYEKMGPDFEVVKIMTELLDELEIGDYEIKLNHRKLLDGMLEICGVPPEKFRTICSSIDKLDKQSFEQIKKEMVEEKGLSIETADKIGNFVKERGPPLELLCKLKQEGSKFLENDISVSALNELEILFNALDKAKCADKVVFDLSLARGLDYYTGVIFEAVFVGATQIGSIAAGGRYDNLIGMFGSKQIPAVGVSLGIERVFAIMEQLQKERNGTIRATKTQVLVSVLGDDISIAAELASELWNAKIEAEFMVNKRVNKHIDRALESRVPYMVLVGERELNAGVVKLKDIEKSQEEEVLRSQFVELLKKRLKP